MTLGGEMRHTFSFLSCVLRFGAGASLIVEHLRQNPQYGSVFPCHDEQRCRWSLVEFMLWLRYGPARGKPLTSLASIYSEYLESPGTKVFTCREAARLFTGAAGVTTRVQLTHRDLLESGAGQRHVGRLFSLHVPHGRAGSCGVLPSSLACSY